MQVRPLNSHCHLKTVLSLCPSKEKCFEVYIVSKVISFFSLSPSVSLSVCMYTHTHKLFFFKQFFKYHTTVGRSKHIDLTLYIVQYSLNITKEEKFLMAIILSSNLGFFCHNSLTKKKRCKSYKTLPKSAFLRSLLK